MVESQDSLYPLDSQDYNLENINTGDLLNSPDLLTAEDAIMNLSPGAFNQALCNTSPDYNVNHCGADIGQQDVYIDHIMIQDPSHFNQLPKIDTLETEWGFNIDLNSETASKASWMFSHKLNKVFVKIQTDLNVYITYNIVIPYQELMVRAMIVYTSPADLAEPVKKCPNHRERSGPNNPEHILTCSKPETSYVGFEAGKLFKDKLALTVPLSAVIQHEPLKFQFSCQNSCSGGMNRKLTSIVFTLENNIGEIYGRKALNFKVCSCPKRDMEKEEGSDAMTKSLPKKRKIEYVAPSTSRKVPMTIAVPVSIVKQESDSTVSVNSDEMLPETPPDQPEAPSVQGLKIEQNCIVPSFAMPCPEMKEMVLTYAYNLVAGNLTRTGEVATYQPYLNELQNKLDDN